MSNEEREKKKRLVMVAVLIGTFVLGIGAWRLLHHDFNIIGQFDEGGYSNGVYVSGSYAYFADGYDGLKIIDISDPTTPTKVGCFHDGDGYTYDVYVSGSFAYVADWEGGLVIIDISDPTDPVQVGHFYEDSIKVYDVSVSGSYAYLADSDGLAILDISDPTTPTKVGHLDGGGYASVVYISGSYAYVATYEYGLKIIDISDPTAPMEVGQVGNGGRPRGVFVIGDYAYVADYRDGLEIIDLWSPKEKKSNIILWSIISILIFIALVDIRGLIKDALPIWEDNRGFKDDFNNPYWDEGKRKKVLDLFLGFFLIIGISLGDCVILFLFSNLPDTEYWQIMSGFLILPLFIILGIIDIIIMNRSLRKNRIYFFLGMIIPFLIGLLIGILLLINQFNIEVSRGTLLVKYPMVHLIILGSLSLSLGVLFLVVLKIYSKEQGDDPLEGEKMSYEESEEG